MVDNVTIGGGEKSRSEGFTYIPCVWGGCGLLRLYQLSSSLVSLCQCDYKLTLLPLGRKATLLTTTTIVIAAIYKW